MPIAKNIKFCRKQLGLTQQAFADAIGVTKSTVIAWENKKTAVSISNVKKAAAFFDVGFTEFCDVDLERLDKRLSGHNVVPTEQEAINLTMFRALPENTKQAFRYLIITEYENTMKIKF